MQTIALIALCGCAGATGQPAVFLTGSNGDTGFVAGALGATERQFFDVDDGSGGLGGGGSGGSGSGSGGQQGPAYVRQNGISLGLGARADQAVAPGWVVESAGSLMIGQADYRLPQGLGIFTDPTDIRFRYRQAQVQAGVGYQPARAGRWVTRFSGGVGLVVTDVATSVQSDLLDVHNQSVLHDRFGYLRATIRPPSPGKAQFFGEVRAYRGSQVAVTYGMTFGH